MDKFLVRTPREQSVQVPKTAEKSFKQATIESLQGVVVIEDIYRLKNKLQLENQSKEIIIESLAELGKKIPSRQVLLSSKIGKVVNKIRKHSDNEISNAAKRVYIKWRKHFEDKLDSPKIEVSCDANSEKMRSSARKFLAGALSLEVSHKLPEAIERESFFQCKRLISVKYRRTMRSLVFTLRHKEEVKAKILSGELAVEDFVKNYKK